MESKEIVDAQVKRIVTNLFKDFLNTLEDIRQDHLKSLLELKQFPPEFIEKLNYLDLPAYSKHRKRTLDKGNDSIRELQEYLNFYNITLK